MRRIASRPSRGRLPCAARPRVSISIHWNPLCATATQIGGFGHDGGGGIRLPFRASDSDPRLARSSSTTAATIRLPRGTLRFPARRARQKHGRHAAFLSCAHGVQAPT